MDVEPRVDEVDARTSFEYSNASVAYEIVDVHPPTDVAQSISTNDPL